MNTKKAEHTPGPWEVHKSRIVKNGSRLQILHPLINGPDAEPQYQGKLGGYHVVMGPQNCQPGYILTEANAALIAAAPEMLEALKICALALENTWETSDEAKMARAAILKAAGK